MAGQKHKRVKALTLDDQRKLARLAARPDVPLGMEFRVWFLEWMLEHRPWFAEQIMDVGTHGTRENEARGRFLVSLLDRAVPSLREVVTSPDQHSAGPTAAVAIRIVGVDRGTKEAREQAIEVQAQKRVGSGA